MTNRPRLGRTSSTPFRITEQASIQIKQSGDAMPTPGGHLRVAAKRQADGSICYAMGFDEPTETDTITTQHNVQIVIALTSVDLLAGAVLDYARPDNDEGDQFIFLNPNDPAFVPPDGER